MSAETKPKFFVPEVVQTSAMDCGPAALKCLLEGFNIHAHYGRLRESCQTDVDGTSINTIEVIANLLGLDAEQIMLPVDHVLMDEAKALPALVVVRLPNGNTHFSVAWRRHGALVQMMDPAKGRQWVSIKSFHSSLYVHSMPVPAAAWREWVGGEESTTVMRCQMRDLGIGRRKSSELLDSALAEKQWRPIAALGAAVRMTASLVHCRALRKGRSARGVIETFFRQAILETSGVESCIPQVYWPVTQAALNADGVEQVILRGAVLLRVRGKKVVDQSLAGEAIPERENKLTPDLARVLSEEQPRPLAGLFNMVRAAGLRSPVVLTLAAVVGAVGVVLQALLFRGLLNISRELGIAPQRFAAMGALVFFLLTLMLLSVPVFSGMMRVGRNLESTLRLSILARLPRLADSFFRSRLASDLAERAHRVHALRVLPIFAIRLVSSLTSLLLTMVGIIWLDPKCAWHAVANVAVALILPMIVQPSLAERDMRIRTHTGTLSRFYLDGLLGLVAARAHAAEQSLRREHESLLVEWLRAAFAFRRAAIFASGASSVIGYGLAVWLVFDHLARMGESGSLLLLSFWALALPTLGSEIATIAWQFPGFRNTASRLFELLSPLAERDQESEVGLDHSAATTPFESGVSVSLSGVKVLAGGHAILSDVSLSIESGEHVAIVGPSGAGKTSLAGVLLGWHRPASGEVRVNGLHLEGAMLERLRQHTAWVDPAVHIWNRSLFDNLLYGARADCAGKIDAVIQDAELLGIIEHLPDGLQTPLGEGGGLVSGGEGQRVRLGRAMVRSDASLVILDEPFRGLDREHRSRLLVRVRELWARSTLLCITHDVEETLLFDRVILIEGGRIIEDGHPFKIAARPQSRYRQMIDADIAIRRDVWGGDKWSYKRMEDGSFVDGDQVGRRT